MGSAGQLKVVITDMWKLSVSKTAYIEGWVDNIEQGVKLAQINIKYKISLQIMKDFHL